jgi:hypothetical protein
MWSLASLGDGVVTLSLTDNEATRKAYDIKFLLTMTLTFDASSVRQELWCAARPVHRAQAVLCRRLAHACVCVRFWVARASVRNDGGSPFDFQALLHTYLAVPAIEAVRVVGGA